MWISDDDSDTTDARSAAGAVKGAQPAERGARIARISRGRLVRIAGRALYWLPVLAPMVLFGQVALLGLRPALCERARLEQAEIALRERYARDAAQNAVIRSSLRARQDPIFLERQRRWLCVAEPAR